MRAPSPSAAQTEVPAELMESLREGGPYVEEAWRELRPVIWSPGAWLLKNPWLLAILLSLLVWTVAGRIAWAAIKRFIITPFKKWMGEGAGKQIFDAANSPARVGCPCDVASRDRLKEGMSGRHMKAETIVLLVIGAATTHAFAAGTSLPRAAPNNSDLLVWIGDNQLSAACLGAALFVLLALLFYLIVVGVEAVRYFVMLHAGGHFEVSFWKLYKAMVKSAFTRAGRRVDLEELHR